MSDDLNPADEVAKTRKGLLGILVAILLVVVAIVGALYIVGIGPFAKAEAEPEAQTTTTKPAETKPAAEEETATPVAATTTTVALPPAAAQEGMYWEQVASAEHITQLVNNEFSAFKLSQVTTTGDKADIRVFATYRDGSSLAGWILLRQYEGAWYFVSLTGDGGSTEVIDLGDADPNIVKAIVEQQAANQDVYKAILDGTYDTIAITRVTAGSGTAMADVELSKNGGTPTKAQISFINEDNGAGTQWFITAFSR